jgi:hypothetical protein
VICGMWFALLRDFQADDDDLHPASSPETSSEDTHTSSSAGSGTSET